MFNWCITKNIKSRSINFLGNWFMLKSTTKYTSGSLLCQKWIQTPCFQRRGLSTQKLIEESQDLNKVSIKGWIKDIQISKECLIINVNEGLSNNNVKVVLPVAYSNKIGVGAPVSIIGENDKENGTVLATEVEVKGNAYSKKEFIHGRKSKWKEIYPEKHLLHPRFRSRYDFFKSNFRIRSKLKTLLHDYFHEGDYIEIDTPILTRYLRDVREKSFYLETWTNKSKKTKGQNGVDDFFGHPVYLSTCRRFHLLCALSGLNKVYSIGPLFRGALGSGGKLLYEFWRADSEEIFFKDKNEAFEDLLIRVEDLIKTIINTYLDEWSQQENWNEQAAMNMKNVLEKKWIKVTYEEAAAILEAKEKERGGTFTYGHSLVPGYQTTLSDAFGSCPIFVTDFPYYSKDFNVALNDKEADKVLAFELLLPNCGTVASGSVKENDYFMLQERLQEYGAEEYYSWFTDMSTWGTAPTMGFSLGIEKLLYFICKADNIKNLIPFPRGKNACEC